MEPATCCLYPPTTSAKKSIAPVRLHKGLPVLSASLKTSMHAGTMRHMGAFRKITVQVPEDDLEMAQAYTGEGVSETVRAGLRRLASMKAQRKLLKLRGKTKFSMTSNELKYGRK